MKIDQKNLSGLPIRRTPKNAALIPIAVFTLLFLAHQLQTHEQEVYENICYLSISLLCEELLYRSSTCLLWSF